jgi:CubicO group peptidase (beta-lactamase class C family)
LVIKGKQIVALVREAEEKVGFSGAVLAAENGKLIAAVAVGKNGKQPLEVTTLFELASCTKPFTAMAVMKLVEEGKLKLDDPIAKYLPGIPEDCQAITVRHLLQHTSGIPGTNSNGHGTDLATVLPTFLAGGPRTPPGEHHEYWNQGYALLSEVIAQASGKPYTQYVREAIFTPCHMKHSRFTVERDDKKLAASINWHGPISYGHLNQGDGDGLTFDMRVSSNKIAVERGADGTVTALTMTDLGASLKFVRVAGE